MLNIDPVTAQRRWPQALFARLESGWSRFKFWRRERAAAKEYPGRGGCWDRVACRSDEAATIYRCSTGEQSGTEQGGGLADWRQSRAWGYTRTRRKEEEKDSEAACEVFQGCKRRQANAHTDGQAHTIDALGEVEAGSHAHTLTLILRQ